MMCNEKINYNAPLTREERKFAEAKHNVIFTYLNKNKLDEREYYDVAALGYLRAVRKYLRVEELRRYSFTTIAYHAMYSECSHYETSKIRKNSKHIYDSDDYDFSLTENIEDSSDDYDTLCERDAAAEQIRAVFSATKSNAHKMIFILLSKEYTHKQIAQIMGISPHTVEKNICKARKSIKSQLSFT